MRDAASVVWPEVDDDDVNNNIGEMTHCCGWRAKYEEKNHHLTVIWRTAHGKVTLKTAEPANRHPIAHCCIAE